MDKLRHWPPQKRCSTRFIKPRKKSFAEAVKNEAGKITVNNRPIDDYFSRETSLMVVQQPLKLTSHISTFDIKITVCGGGETGQAGAIRHGVTRALIDYDSLLKTCPIKAGFVTRDAVKLSVKK